MTHLCIKCTIRIAILAQYSNDEYANIFYCKHLGWEATKKVSIKRVNANIQLLHTITCVVGPQLQLSVFHYKQQLSLDEQETFTLYRNGIGTYLGLFTKFWISFL